MKKKYQPYEINVQTIGFYIDRLLFAMIKSRNNDLKEINSDLLHSEFVVLKVLNILKCVSQSQLADIMGKERSGLTRILTSLEQKGYVSRKAFNGSTNHVTLSAKGEKIMPTIFELSEKLNERAFKGFSEKSKTSLLKNLDKMYRNFTSDEVNQK